MEDKQRGNFCSAMMNMGTLPHGKEGSTLQTGLHRPMPHFILPPHIASLFIFPFSLNTVRKIDPRPIYFGFWCLMINTTKLD